MALDRSGMGICCGWAMMKSVCDDLGGSGDDDGGGGFVFLGRDQKEAKKKLIFGGFGKVWDFKNRVTMIA